MRGGTSLFVSVANGSDTSGDGSIGRPFASLSRAQTAARLALGRTPPATPVTVLVRAGTYYLKEPLWLRLKASVSGAGRKVRDSQYKPKERIWLELKALGPGKPGEVGSDSVKYFGPMEME